MRTLVLKLLIVLLNIPTMLSGQSKHYWEFNFAPTLSYLFIDGESKFNNYGMVLRYDIGINYGYAITNKIDLFTGIGYSRMGFNLTINDPQGTGAVSEVLDYTLYRDFLEFPISSRYNFKIVGKNSFYLGAGIINQIYFYGETIVRKSSKDFVYKHSYSDLKEVGLKTYNLALIIAPTYQRELSDKFYLTINPFFKYGLLSLNNIHDLSIGLKVGTGVKY